MPRRMNDAEFRYVVDWLCNRRSDQRITDHGIEVIKSLVIEAGRLREFEIAIRSALQPETAQATGS